MPTVTIRHGGSRDGWVWLSINGVEQWAKAGEPIELSTAEVELLGHADIEYDIVASGNFTNIATSNIADGVYTLNGSPCTFEDIVDLASVDTAFDPDGVDSGGIFCPPAWTQALGLKAPLLTTALAGFTAVFELNLVVGGNIAVFMHDDNFNLYTSLVTDDSHTDLDDKDGTVVANTADHFVVGMNKVAFTCASDRLSASVNGGAVVGGAATPLDPLMSAIAFSMSADENTRLRSFAFYEVVDDADLPALSSL